MKRISTLATAAILLMIVESSGQSAAIDRFRKQLYDRIYAQWAARMKPHENELTAGTIKVRLTMTRSGQILDIHILSTSASQRLRKLTLDAIKHTQVPALPDFKGQQKIDCDLTFRLVQD